MHRVAANHAGGASEHRAPVLLRVVTLAAYAAREFAAILIAGLEEPAIPSRQMYTPSIRAAIALAYEPGVTIRIAQDRVVTVYVARRPEEE
jgi:hypothetical protein